MTEPNPSRLTGLTSRGHGRNRSGDVGSGLHFVVAAAAKTYAVVVGGAVDDDAVAAAAVGFAQKHGPIPS